MLSSSKKEPDTFPKKIRDAYKSDISKAICITTGLTTLICKISLQFCCEFIDNNRSNILLTRNVARLIKLPTSILYIAHSIFILQDLVKDYKDPKGKRELAKIVGKSANLASSIIVVLMQMRIIHLLAASAVSYLRFASTILFLFIVEPINYYYTYKKYQDNQDPNKSAECERALIVSTLTFSLGLVGFIVDNMDLPNVPINLGNGVVYNFSLSVTISIIYSAVFLAFQFKKLFSQPINDVDPSSKLEDVHHDANGHAIEVN